MRAHLAFLFAAPRMRFTFARADAVFTNMHSPSDSSSIWASRGSSTSIRADVILPCSHWETVTGVIFNTREAQAPDPRNFRKTFNAIRLSISCDAYLVECLTLGD